MTASKLDPNDLDADTPFDFPERLVLSAAGRPPPKTKGAPSVFALGKAFAMVLAELPPAPAVDGIPDGRAPWQAKVTREAGLTRCTGTQYPANRWDPDRVAQLRKHQQTKYRPPKPSKAAKSKSQQLRGYIAFSGDDWDA